MDDYKKEISALKKFSETEYFSSISKKNQKKIFDTIEEYRTKLFNELSKEDLKLDDDANIFEETLSDDIIDEYIDVSCRKKKLSEYINSLEFKNLSEELKILLIKQSEVMSEYKDILIKRLFI